MYFYHRKAASKYIVNMASRLPPTRNRSSKTVEQTLRSSRNPRSRSEKITSSYCSDRENVAIEKACQGNRITHRVQLNDRHNDFETKVPVSNTDNSNQILISPKERGIHSGDFLFSLRPFTDEYGWIPPFLMETTRHLKLKLHQVPSKNPQLIPELVEKAADGIVEEGKYLHKEHEAKRLAELLRKTKKEGIENVWECCVYLYTSDSFLYKTLNETMRLVGDEEHKETWQSKVHTLGPFCLLLWDDPVNTKLTFGKTLYRGTDLTTEQIAYFKELAKDDKTFQSFQFFVSCSRNRKAAQIFGNTLFIMEAIFAFTVNAAPYSDFSDEEEEIIMPGVCFCVKNIEFDSEKNKHFIHLQLRQRFSCK